MFDRIRSALAARRAAMLEAEVFVLRYSADAEYWLALIRTHQATIVPSLYLHERFAL